MTGGTITGQQTGQTGLFAVCYQLSRRGWNVQGELDGGAGPPQLHKHVG
jgi:hypothetical protein